MIELSAKTYGDANRLGAMLEGAAAIPHDLSQVFPAIAARFHIQMARRFSDQGASGPSGRWTDLSPRYAAWKAKRYPNAGILVRTGAMRESLTSFGPNSYTYYGPTSVFIGSLLEYPEFHQAGTASMPQRKIIDPTDRDAAEWVAEIVRFHARRTSRLGWKGRFAGAMAGSLN